MIKLPCLLQFRILREALKAFFTGPYTSKFPYEPHEPAERFRGKPQFSEGDCVGCAACVQVCPARAITFDDEIQNGKAIRKLVIRWDLCIFCGQCELNCLSEKGIKLTKEFDFASPRRGDFSQEIKKDLVLCEDCGCVIAPRDQILWVAKKLGPLAFSNTSIMVFSLKNKNLVLDIENIPPSKEEVTAQRSDRLRVLCPKCRRRVVLAS
jgi:hydrogenase-4 component H